MGGERGGARRVGGGVGREGREGSGGGTGESLRPSPGSLSKDAKSLDSSVGVDGHPDMGEDLLFGGGGVDLEEVLGVWADFDAVEELGPAFDGERGEVLGREK